MNRNGKLHGVTHNVVGKPADKLNVPVAKIRTSGSAVNPQPKRQPGSTGTSGRHVAH